MTDLEKAIEIATEAHKNQFDKAGEDYIKHPIKVASMVDSENEKIVAYLHDVVEDTDITLNDLKETGFSDEVVEAIDAITKQKGENYDAYIKRVSNNEIAKKVKIADMAHNADISRFDNPTLEDIIRCEKYRSKLNILLSL